MTYFVFSIHNHQPVGNFTHVLEEAFDKAYNPFIETLSEYPRIKLSFHISGFLLDWLSSNRPGYIELLRSMVASGQVEIMGGAYYEPVLAVIPAIDRVGQITRLADRIEGLFGRRPRGLWLAERVWEPALPESLAKAGVEYVVVDDFHFIKSGLKVEDLGGYYVTEDSGSMVKVFAGSERLRYLIPFEPVEKFDEFVRGSSGRVAIFADDGEKFGIWPGTNNYVYAEGWLRRFFDRIDAMAGDVRPATFSEVLDSEEPLGSVYLPTTSYMEMGGWALPAEASIEYALVRRELESNADPARAVRFLQGGTWRNFFTKYPEANWMHKRMLAVSAMLDEARSVDAGSLDADALARATDLLYRAQCNDAYWHGVFGGLYLPHLRTAVFENLIRAEQLIERILGRARSGRVAIETVDMDTDGHDEIIIRTNKLNIYLSPRDGGVIREIDYIPKAVNITNTLSRWYEGYHEKLIHEAAGAGQSDGQGEGQGTNSIHDTVSAKEKGLEEFLSFDSVQRAFMRVYLLEAGATIAPFMASKYDRAEGLHNTRYEARILDDDDNDKGVVLTGRAAMDGARIELTKELTIEADNAFNIALNVEATSGGQLSGVLAVEFNMILPGCSGPDSSYGFSFAGDAAKAPALDASLASFGEIRRLKGVTVVDGSSVGGLAVSLTADTEVTLWRAPIHTVSSSEAGYERIFQGSCLVFVLPVSIEEHEEARLAIKVVLDEL